ncbi:MAG: hypothetical protein K2X76_03035, partial [Sphingomonas sp.]|nr:hypothetical protein [Sphingomonas sp.]
TAAPVASGDYLGALAPLPARAIKRGAPLTLRAMAGPIVIEREVRAVQPARAGGRVFVRDADGHVFAAPLVIAQADQ